MAILTIPIHLVERFLFDKFGNKYAYINSFKGPVYFYERKFKAPQKVQIWNLMRDM